MANEDGVVRPFGEFSSGLAADLLAEVDQRGYLVLTRTGFKSETLQDCYDHLLDFCQALGKPLPHNADPTSLVWPIKPVPGVNRAFNTHSELSAFAELHTDSAFSSAPDDYFCLYSLNPARCGGGETLLLSAEDFCADLASTSEGREAEAIFRSEPFPFAVPTVFQGTGDLKRPYVEALVLEGPTIRFRADVIERAVTDHGASVTPQQRSALTLAKRLCEGSKKLQCFALPEDAMIIINNKTMLHGRTAFSDDERHLLRVRLHRH